jgi:hypothetical protein
VTTNKKINDKKDDNDESVNKFNERDINLEGPSKITSALAPAPGNVNV